MTRQGIDKGQSYVKANPKGVTRFFLGEKKGKGVVEKVWDQYQSWATAHLPLP